MDLAVTTHANVKTMVNATGSLGTAAAEMVGAKPSAPYLATRDGSVEGATSVVSA